MAEELEKFGLFFDDIYSIRVQNPKITNETNDLKEECDEYASKLQEFKKLSQNFQKLSENYSKQVEIEKIRAISTQNHLKTISKQRQVEQQFYQNKIQEMSQVLDKLKMEYQYLQRVESEQMEVINNFIQNQ